MRAGFREAYGMKQDMKILLALDQSDQGNNGTTISASVSPRRWRRDGNEGFGLRRRETCGGKYPMPEIHFLPVADSIIRSQGYGVLRNRTVPSAGAGGSHGRTVESIFMMPLCAFPVLGPRIAKRNGQTGDSGVPCAAGKITSTIHLGKIKRPMSFSWANGSEMIFIMNLRISIARSPFIAGQLKEHGYQAKLHIISNGVSDEFYPRVRQRSRAGA